MIRKLTGCLFILAFCDNAFAATGFLQGERGSGLNKICYYDGVSGAFTKTIGSTQICPLSADDGRNAGSSSSSNIGMLSGEETNGFNKTCYYSSVRGTFTKTIGSTQICPLNTKQ